MIELQPFTEKDFNTFKSWIHNEEQLFQFAGTIFSYPVTNEQLSIYIKTKDKKPYKVVLKSTNETIGHCELNCENQNHRLSRILIGQKEMRGKKIGEQIVRKMVSLFFLDNQVNEVDLNVFEWNKEAIKCYKKVGFQINTNNTIMVTVNDQQWPLLNMSLKRKHITTAKIPERLGA